MPKQKQDWNEIMERYKASNVSQPGFCKLNELSYNQFQYRWQQHKVLKAKACRGADNQPSLHTFEPVTIALPSISPKQEAFVVELAIHLPNKIRCDVKIDLCADAFSTLLKQLVILC